MAVPDQEARTAVDVSVVTVGPFASAVSPLPHHSIAIHLSGNSTVEWKTEGKVAGARPVRGDLTLIPAGQSGYLDVSGGTSKVLKIGIPDAALAHHEREVGVDAIRVRFLERFFVTDALAQQLGMALLLQSQDRATRDVLYAERLSDALVAHLIHSHAIGSSRKERPMRVHALPEWRARRAIEFMESNLAFDLRLGDIAGAAGLSGSHFCAQFKARFGRTVWQHLTLIRLERACALLSRRDLPVAQVADEVGFTTASHFSRVFRGAYGVTPTAFQAIGKYDV